MQEPHVLLYLAALYVIVPVALAKFIVRANWIQIGVAYAILYLGLALLAGGGSSSDETIGWMLIIGMFVSIPAIPALTLMMRTVGWVRRRLAR